MRAAYTLGFTGILATALGFSACSGKTFDASRTDAAVGASDADSETTQGIDADEPDECAGVNCAVPDCPPQSQHTEAGECCPVCDAPAACEDGVRCDALSCPGEMREVTDGCCLCQGTLPECEGDALPCTDSACRGTEQEVVGEGCCLCGELLECPAGQAACDTILCGDQEVLYRDGCCACAVDEGCGQGSTACDLIDCASGVDQVGGGCCVCEEEEQVQCESGSAPCDSISCEVEPIDVGDGCCQCVDECGLLEGESNCELLDCVGDLIELSAGCCMCEAQGSCETPAVPCENLSCPATHSVEQGDGCCTCYECPQDTAPCSNVVCSEGFEPSPLGDDCCSCQPAMMMGSCEQEQYVDAKAASLEELGDPACGTDEDCRVIALINQCYPDCAVPVHVEIADKFQSQVNDWAAEHCVGCMVGSVDCPAVESVARCFDGRCLRDDTM